MLDKPETPAILEGVNRKGITTMLNHLMTFWNDWSDGQIAVMLEGEITTMAKLTKREQTLTAKPYLTPSTQAEADDQYDAIFRMMRLEDGYQMFGYDWVTLRITRPGEYAQLRAILAMDFGAAYDDPH